MRARLMALAAAALLLLLPFQASWAAIDITKPDANSINLDLPDALAEDDSFTDLPFEQLRQALREEVEHDPNKRLIPHSTKRYNLLIR